MAKELTGFVKLQVKGAAAWALGKLTKNSEQIALRAVQEDDNVIDSLILCIQEPDIYIKKNAFLALICIAKHSSQLTEAINTNDNINIIAYYLKIKDTEIQNIVINCLKILCKNLK